MSDYTTIRKAVWNGKRSNWCKAVGGFSVYRLSSGDVDWFMFGQPPHKDGNVDRNAQLIERWSYVGGKWRQI
ncbi:MAG: hypothetical protein KatS3mg054_0336 [Chloroflexus sp.]|nr:MAG: hypothetical protein KatS3mg054_0336 [Chloroflexus sp.]